MVQRSVESATQSSADVQQSVFASVDSVPAFSATAACEQEQGREPIPRLAELQLSSPSAGKTSPASKKKLMSMAFQVQKRRREAAAAAAAAAAEVSSNADSSDTETLPARGRGCHHSSATHTVSDQSSVDDGRQAQADGGHASEQHVNASVTSATEADDADGASAARAVGAVTIPPKTLTPAKTLPASLVTTEAYPDDRRHSIDDILSSPVKLVPPVDPQHIHAVVAADITSTTSDETTQPDLEDTEQQ